MAEATTYGNGISEQENQLAFAEMKKSGKTTFYEPTPEEQAGWHRVLEPVTDQMADRLGRDLIAEFQKEAKGATTN
jgi:C4-dicarboxylate-binding protein DctP